MKIRIATTTCVCIVLMSMSVFATPTSNRNLMDFCESYMKRLVSVIKENNIDYDLYTFGGSVLADFSDIAIVSVTAGALDVKKKDMLISEGDFTFYVPSQDENKNVEHIMSFIASLSALEFDSMEDSIRSIESKIAEDSQSCFEDAKSIYDDDICQALTSEAYARAKDGEEVIVYSGNYDYFLKYKPIENSTGGYEMYSIVAKEHE